MQKLVFHPEYLLLKDIQVHINIYVKSLTARQKVSTYRLLRQIFSKIKCVVEKLAIISHLGTEQNRTEQNPVNFAVTN